MKEGIDRDGYDFKKKQWKWNRKNCGNIKKSFDTDILVGGKENDGSPQYDAINWHKQMFDEGHLYTYMQKMGKS